MNDQLNQLIPSGTHLGTRIPGDVVNRATADLPDEHRSLIRRFHSHYTESELSLEEAGRLIGYSQAVVGLVFRGKYDGKLDPFVKELKSFFDLHDRRGRGRKLSFIKTDLTERIWSICTAALEFQKMAFIFGDQQIGKTEALIAYRDNHNHGSTIYVRMPTGGAMCNFLYALARELRIGENLSVTRLRERIKKSFDDRMLLLVDEVHACIREQGRSQNSTLTIDFIREIFDEAHCGVVLCGTNVFRNAMDEGPVQKILRQTKRRRLCSLQLPDSPTQSDLNIFAAAYGLKPSAGETRDLERRVIDAEALGMWLTLLRMGARLAAERKQTMTWNHVLKAHAGLQILEGKKF